MYRLTLFAGWLSLFFSLGTGQASVVKTDHARIELIAEENAIVPGQSFNVAIHFDLEEHWHIYWKNPGSSGLAPQLTWRLPDGIEAGEVQWPAPKRIAVDTLVSYGYENHATFIVPMSVSKSLQTGEELTLGVDLSFLICKDICLPGKASPELKLPVEDVSQKSAWGSAFEKARASLPKLRSDWSIAGRVESEEALVLTISGSNIPSDLYFYASDEGITDPNAEQTFSYSGPDRAELRLLTATPFQEWPTGSIRGLLQSAEGTWVVDPIPFFESSAKTLPSGMVVEPETAGFEQSLLSIGLPGFLLLAFLGGGILNLMPCVLPVLSLKVFSLLKHGGQTRSEAIRHGWAYTAGVVSGFLVLAGILFALRAFGEQIGWGFQLQSPGFVVVLTAIFFLFGLNLMGIFELGGRLIGADTKVAQRNDLLGSFGMGTLAAVVGAPCMGPLIAGVSGVAIQVHVLEGLLIFGTMGLGLASPFLLISCFPKLVVWLPKPGAWMESFKQGMGFLLMAAVVFLAVVSGRQGGVNAIVALLVVMLFCAIGAWIFGRWAAPVRSVRTQWIAGLLAAGCIIGSIVRAIPVARSAYAAYEESEVSEEGWETWSADQVDTLLAEGRPVFVDFTATWCLICQANKKLALRTDATEDLFEEYNIAALSADWTRYDPEITQMLEHFDRSGVPLYLLYAPDGRVHVLPQNLTNGIIREFVKKALDG